MLSGSVGYPILGHKRKPYMFDMASTKTNKKLDNDIYIGMTVIIQSGISFGIKWPQLGVLMVPESNYNGNTFDLIFHLCGLSTLLWRFEV